MEQEQRGESKRGIQWQDSEGDKLDIGGEHGDPKDPSGTRKSSGRTCPNFSRTIILGYLPDRHMHGPLSSYAIPSSCSCKAHLQQRLPWTFNEIHTFNHRSRMQGNSSAVKQQSPVSGQRVFFVSSLCSQSLSANSSCGGSGGSLCQRDNSEASKTSENNLHITLKTSFLKSARKPRDLLVISEKKTRVMKKASGKVKVVTSYGSVLSGS